MAKRRTKGDGGLYQRHDHGTCPPLDANGERPAHRCQGRWVGTIDVIDETGKRRRKTIYGRTQAQAKVKLNAAQVEKKAGTLVLATMTTEKWLNHWLEKIAARDIKAQTQRGYRGYLDRYLIPQLGRRRLTDLRPEHVRDLHDWMREQGLSEATVRQAHAILKKALRDAVFEGKLAISPADRVKSPKVEKNSRRSLSAADAKRVLMAAGDDARWWLALFYGMRQGEVLGLRWCDVDFDRHTLSIEQTLITDENYQLRFDTPKSRASRRVLPLVSLMEARLRLHHVNSGSPSARSTDLVFSDGGLPIWPNKDWQAWRDLLTRATTPPLAPVPHIALHAARNSAASLLEEAGVPDRLVMQILGHSQVQITHGYQSADLARMVTAFEALGTMLELE